MKRDAIRRKRSKIKATAPGKLMLVLISVLFIIGMTAGCTVKIVRNSGKADVPANGKTVTGAKQEDGGTSTQEQPDSGTSTQEQPAGKRTLRVMARIVWTQIEYLYLRMRKWLKHTRRRSRPSAGLNGSMPADYEDAIEMNGYVYNRATHDVIKTMDDLKSYLQTMFTDEIVEGLLAGDGSGIQLYRDIDGALYTIPAGRGSDIMKGDETYEIIREGDKKVIYQVTVEIYDDPFEETVAGTEQYDFPLEYINGRWVFTDFELVR